MQGLATISTLMCIVVGVLKGFRQDLHILWCAAAAETGYDLQFHVYCGRRPEGVQVRLAHSCGDAAGSPLQSTFRNTTIFILIIFYLCRPHGTASPGRRVHMCHCAHRVTSWHENSSQTEEGGAHCLPKGQPTCNCVA